jgi:hypothetical protein
MHWVSIYCKVPNLLDPIEELDPGFQCFSQVHIATGESEIPLLRSVVFQSLAVTTDF